jgi:carboxypeptidase family protein
MKKILVPLMIIVFLLSACSFNVQVLEPGALTPAAPPSTDLGLTSTQSITTTPEPFSSTPIPTPVPTDPRFFDARFALDPANDIRQSLFPFGIQKIYAIWNYENMRQGLIVRREWYLDGKPWLTREEPWDFAKYGANGTIRDVSIYDLDHDLASGVYQLRIFIDNVPQLISVGNSYPAETSASFEIHPTDEAIGWILSPDGQWGGNVYGEKRIVLRDLNGTPTLLYTAGYQIPYYSWFSDSRHLLFVDRDNSRQQTGTTTGIRDNLWVIDIPSGELHLLYESNIMFGGYAGPVVSPDGHFIASMEGSGFADACMKDSRVIFFELGDDLHSAKSIKQEQFAGFPSSNAGSVYPVEDGEWETNNLYLITLDGTCAVDKSKMGPYLFNLSNLTTAKSSSATMPLIAGDLGWGKIHGKIVDTVTGAPVVGATVSCEHHSYTSPLTCSGTATTNADGIYIFGTVFFHDTDTVKLTVQAPGYQVFEYTQNSFTTNGMETNLSLTRAP